MSVEYCQPRENVASKSGLLRLFSRSSKGVLSHVFSVEKTTPGLPTVPPRPRATTFGKLRDQLGRRERSSKVRFPPSSWDTEQNISGPSDTSDTAETQDFTQDEISQSTPVERSSIEGTSPNDASSQAAVGAPVEPLQQVDQVSPEEPASGPVSPTTLAHRIHALLSSFPPFHALSSSNDSAMPLSDSKLLSLLSSATAMNGSLSRGRESVWSILERLRYTPNSKSEGRDKTHDESGTATRDGDLETSSVMLCCPLELTEDTEVEIARSEVVSVVIEDDESPTEAGAAQEPKLVMNIWNFRKDKGKEKASSSETSQPSPRIKEVRVWIPSRTKVSLQAAWWGYRIYLPPPIMRVLDDKSLEAAKRAAMITAVLSWLVSHIPTTMLPPQIKAVVGIVKGIVPIIGYVGGFIAWSWNTIQSFDKGQGVILSATWLLPIALLPGTWDYVPPDNFPDTIMPPLPPPKDHIRQTL